MRKKLIAINFITALILLTVLIREDYPKRIYKRLFISKIKTEQIENKNENDVQVDKYEYQYKVEDLKFKVWTSLFDIYDKKDCKIAFLGNSIIYSANWAELLNRNDIINRGIGSQTTKNLIELSDYAIERKPEFIFVMGGINDLNREIKLDTIIDNYTVLIKKIIKSNITPIIQSTLYVAKSRDNSKIINQKVDSLNNYLLGLSLQENIDFLNITEPLSNDNYLKDEFTYDGIHLNGQGYKTWKEKLLQYMKKSGI